MWTNEGHRQNTTQLQLPDFDKGIKIWDGKEEHPHQAGRGKRVLHTSKGESRFLLLTQKRKKEINSKIKQRL